MQYTDSEDGDTTVLSGRRLFYLPFFALVLSSETSGYTFVYEQR